MHYVIVDFNQSYASLFLGWGGGWGEGVLYAQIYVLFKMSQFLYPIATSLAFAPLLQPRIYVFTIRFSSLYLRQPRVYDPPVSLFFKKRREENLGWRNWAFSDKKNNFQVLSENPEQLRLFDLHCVYCEANFPPCTCNILCQRSGSNSVFFSALQFKERSLPTEQLKSFVV